MPPSKDAAAPMQKMLTASFAQAKDVSFMTYFMTSSCLTKYVLSCNLLNASCGAPRGETEGHYSQTSGHTSKKRR